MRRAEREKLQQPYPEATPIPERFAGALDVVLPAIREVHREVLADFDEVVHGIGWWAPHPGASRRILISDHLLTCIAGVETNMVEAKLHLVELADFDEQVDRIIAHAVKHDRQGRPSAEMPAREKAADDLPDRMATLHIAGFFRALGSSLDCLGAAIVGVLALPTSILKADIDRALGALDRVKTSATPGEQMQVAFRTELKRLIAAAGPPGWLPWATDYRNMLVHRGRRLQLFLLKPRGAQLFAADERPVVLASAVRQLAQDPGLSDVEALLSMSTRAPVVTENAQDTLDGLMESALKLTEGVAAALVGVWKSRRASPAALLQPKEQWRDGRSSASHGFAGYKPGTVPFSANALVSEETLTRRLQTAAIDDIARKKWDKFD